MQAMGRQMINFLIQAVLIYLAVRLGLSLFRGARPRKTDTIRAKKQPRFEADSKKIADAEFEELE